MARRNQVDIQIRATDLASKTVRGVRKELTGLGGAGKIARAGVLAAAGGAAALAAAAAGAAAAGANMAANYEEGLANVNTLLGGNSDRIKELGEDVKRLSIQTGKPLNDLTNGLYQVVSAFGDSADTAKSLEIAVHAARAGVASTTDAINLISAVTKGYGDTTAEAQQHVSDLATLTVKMGQTTFPELAQSIGRVTPLSQALGVSQEELFAVMATGTGVTGNAAEVSTQLRGVLQGLMAPTKDLQGLYDKLGVSGGKALIEQQGLEGAIQTVVQAAKDSGTPIQKYIQQIEGQTLALTLAGSQSDTYAQKLAELGNAAGATDKAFAVQQDTVNALKAQIAQAGKVILIDIGEKVLPLLKTFLEWVVAHLPQIMQTVEDVFDGIGKTLQGAGAIITTVIGIFKTQTADGSSATSAALEVLKTAWTDARDLVKAVVDVLVALWQNVLKPTFKAIAPVVRDVFKIIGDILDTSIKVITQVLEALAAFLNGDFTGAWDHMKGAVVALMQGLARLVEDIFRGLIDALKNIGKLLLEGLVAGIKGAWSMAKTAVTDTGDKVVGWFKGVFKIHSPSQVLYDIGVNLLQGLAGGLADTTQLQAAADAAKNASEAILHAAKIALGLEQPPNPWKLLGQSIVQGIKDGIDAELPGLRQYIQGHLAANNLAPNLKPPTGTGSSPDAYVPPPLGIDSGYGPRKIPTPSAFATVPSARDIGFTPGSSIIVYAPNLREPGDLSKTASYTPGPLGTGYDTRRIPGPGASVAVTPGRPIGPPNAAVTIGSGVGTDQGALMNWVFSNQQDNGQVGPAATNATNALKTFGDSLLGLAKDNVPLLGSALQGLAEGGPIGAVAAIFTELLSRSQAFQDLLQLVTAALEPLVEAAGQVLQAFMPIIEPLLQLTRVLGPVIQLIAQVLTPPLRVLGFVVAALANIFIAAANTIIDVINFLLGWIGVHLDRIKPLDPGATETPAPAPTPPSPPSPPNAPPTGAGTNTTYGAGNISPATQYAIATPLVEAADNMLTAAHLFSTALTRDGGHWDRLSHIVTRFEHLYGDVEAFYTRLLDNGITIHLDNPGSGGSSTAYLRP